MSPLSLILLAASLANIQATDEVPLTGETVLRFDTIEQGQQALTRRDAYMANLGAFEVGLRLHRQEPSTAADLAEFAAGQVVAWPEGSKERVAKAAEAVRPKLEPYKLGLPKVVQLVLTTGKEEGGAAYCRADDTIVFPESYARFPDAQLQRLLLHELFHVVSRNRLDIQEELYGTVNFRPVAEISLPDALRDKRLTNPDAPTINCVIDIEGEEGEAMTVTPVLALTVDEIDPDDNSPFFRYLATHLMAVEKVGDAYRPVLRDGEPVLIDARLSESYLDKTGRNTGYIIHPEEILADHFALLVLGGDEDLKSPEMVEALGRLLAR